MPGLLYHTYRQIHEYESSLQKLTLGGFGPGTAPFNILYEARNKVLASVGLKASKSVLSILRLVGLSPGSVNLWHDGESGFMTEAKTKPGAPSVYKRVPIEVALTILKGEMTHDLEDQLMTPDDYMGE